jgi:anthranilate phosphoribosyltransferase
MDGELTQAQAGAFLMGLRAKGETPEEMLAAVNAILERAVTVDVPQDAAVLDIVGTGGDGRFSFNCSSGTALILAALENRIVKHGNRSVSSKCGSADVLEGLGFDLELSPEEIPARVREDNFVFLFAPRFHPCFRHIMPVRRELGVRTLFNLLGPLVNPARPGLCFLGVPNPQTLPLVAQTLASMGGRSGAVVYGAGGYDELTTLGPAEIAYVRGGKVTYGKLDPAEYGFSPVDQSELAISGPEEGVAVLKELLDGRGPEAMRQMLALNVGFGLYLLRPEQPLAACMAEAKKVVASGVAGSYVRAVAGRYAQRRALKKG